MRKREGERKKGRERERGGGESERGERGREREEESAGYFHPKSVEGFGSDVRVHRRPSVPRRRRACHPCQHTVVSSRQVLSSNHSAWS